MCILGYIDQSVPPAYIEVLMSKFIKCQLSLSKDVVEGGWWECCVGWCLVVFGTVLGSVGHGVGQGVRGGVRGGVR